ncbi:DUF1541 domain-containing protein [Salinicoccus sp. ID82-1]|uniref:DUF1541 domain-containing protein n=1 Tax=Salinicoccus cyprini TaxID=2493691 RepID=A0A558AUX9_9STAP|nr:MULTISPECIES: DUF1541 domain-containing protein [Salinicoccus]MCG1010560.1 DUF1541 domain-containing protein [Salinicoccus sp. ID82-1]TVT28073.1 DUF1541 domain-containing protein [Salinicoccus cyprini]
MKNIKYLFGATAVTALILGACGAEESTSEHGSHEESMDHSEMEHSGMDHSSSGEVPESLAEAEDPTYPVDSQAIIRTEHMAGMNGATATITGAFDTTAYAVTYTPETGGDPVENHKWVVHEELDNPGEAPLAQGDEATMNATHMEGMDGATATIDSAEQTTVYMVSYTDTETGNEVQHHKWVTEDELEPLE